MKMANGFINDFGNWQCFYCENQYHINDHHPIHYPQSLSEMRELAKQKGKTLEEGIVVMDDPDFIILGSIACCKDCDEKKRNKAKYFKENFGTDILKGERAGF